MRLQVLGPVTIADLIGMRRREDERQAFPDDAKVSIIRQHSPGRTHYAALIDTRLDRRRLMDLLFDVAPYKAHGPDRFSRVLDNWALFERAITSSTSEHLMLEHAGALRFSWQEFARHRHVFIEVLQDQTGRRCVTPALAWSRDAAGKRQWEFDISDEEMLKALEEMGPDGEPQRLDTLVGLVSIPYCQPELRDRWPAWQPLKKGGKSNYIGPASVPVISLMHRRALLNSKLVQRLEHYVSDHSH